MYTRRRNEASISTAYACFFLFLVFHPHRDCHRVLNLLLRLRVASILLLLIESSTMRKWQQQLSGKKLERSALLIDGLSCFMLLLL